MYGPAPLRWLLIAYVEVLRGTPLMLQLFVIFFLLPEIGMPIPAFCAAVAGLAINYSAYEAEIYRAGLQAVPRGQMEAALALGMSPALALRRIIVPQAVRIVIPPVTNDFIALFKDTSVCSVITVMELTKQYSVQRNDTGATLELAALTAPAVPADEHSRCRGWRRAWRSGWPGRPRGSLMIEAAQHHGGGRPRRWPSALPIRWCCDGVSLSVQRGEVCAVSGRLGQRQDHVPALLERLGDF